MSKNRGQAPLPVDDDGRPVPGMAVHAHVDCPVRWDWLPTEADAARMAATGRPAPPVTATRAFDQFFTPPAPHPLDEAALTSVLGPPVDGRWQIGGRGATHEFADPAHTSNTVLVRAPWGHRDTTTAPAETATDTGTDIETDAEGEATAAAECGLSPVAVEVLALIRGGTVSTGAIVAAATGSRGAIHTGIDALIGAGLIVRAGRGRYQAVTQAADSGSGGCGGVPG